MATPLTISQPAPLIPLVVADAPTQRLYLCSVLALVQSYKLFQFLEAHLSPSTSPYPADYLLFRWAIIDALLLGVLVPTLRVPWFRWSRLARIVLVASVWLVNWLVGGGWTWSGVLGIAEAGIPLAIRSLFEYQIAILEKHVRLPDVLGGTNTHLLGKFTVHILPHSTAKFNPTSQCFCLPPSSSKPIFVPLLLNNSSPHLLQLSHTPLSPPLTRTLLNLTRSDLRLIRRMPGPSSSSLESDKDRKFAEWRTQHDRLNHEGQLVLAEGEVDERNLLTNGPVGAGDDPDEGVLVPAPGKTDLELRPSQTLFHVPVYAPGVYRLERVLDREGSDIRVSRSPRSAGTMTDLAMQVVGQAIVVPCPGAWFTSALEEEGGRASGGRHGCVGGEGERKADARLRVTGYEPLSVAYRKLLLAGGTSGRTGKRDDLLFMDGIGSTSLPSDRTTSTGVQVTPPEGIPIQLNATYDLPGLHVYALETVTDACGNRISYPSRTFEQWEDDALDRLGETSSTVQSAKGKAKAVAGKLKTQIPLKLGEVEKKVRKARSKGKRRDWDWWVHKRARASVAGCRSRVMGASGASGWEEGTLRVVRNSTAVVGVKIDSGADGGLQMEADGPWEVEVEVEPAVAGLALEGVASGDEAGGGWLRGKGRKEKAVGGKRTLKVEVGKDGVAKVPVDFEGTVRVLGVKGRYCEGDVLAPSACQILHHPLPSAEISILPLLDSCAGSIGASATILFSGTPPFTLHYTVIRSGSPPRQRTFNVPYPQMRGELPITPGEAGEWKYEFGKLEDANYKGDKGTRVEKKWEGRVHPLAEARWKGGREEETEHGTCEGESYETQLELKGVAPWEIEYHIPGDRLYHVGDIKKSPHKLSIPIPASLVKSGGNFNAVLVSVKDGRGCKRTLSVPDLAVAVHRTRPTAKFYSHDARRYVLVPESQRAKLPMRLTGKGPWDVSYRRDSDKPITTRLRNANDELLVPQAGVYRILSVKDRFCPGTVSEAESEFVVEWIPRPQISLQPAQGSVRPSSKSRPHMITRAPVCQHTEDSIIFDFVGSPPFSAGYDVTLYGKDGSKVSPAQQGNTLRAAQNQAVLRLATAQVGRHVYSFTSIADDTYPVPFGLKPDVSGGAIKVEQEVFALPRASFVKPSRVVQQIAPHKKSGRDGATAAFCVNDQLSSKDLAIQLEGQAPFEIEVEVYEDGSHAREKYTLKDLKGPTWEVDLPYTLSFPGHYTVSVRRIIDANGCSRVLERGSLGSSAGIDVAEIASIAPVQPSSWHCVGDMIDFVLQGSAPWTVTYDFEGKEKSVTVIQPKFSRVAEKEGRLRIRKVAHREDRCESKVVDLVKEVKKIPTARVSKGRNVIEDIKEGDQAEIVFSFEGVPPFAFTYIRTLPQDKYKKPEILETHTVTNIMAHEHSIYTSQEGTWSVTFIQDKHCAYPPVRGTELLLE